MRYPQSIGALLVALSGIATAAAAPASPDEALRLTALFESYVGHAGEGRPSPVKVVPHGEAYTATLDVTRMLGFLSAAGIDAVAGDLVAELVPQDGGRWHVTIDGFPPIGVAHEGRASSFALDGYRFDGLFDPAIQTFASSAWSSKGSTTHMVGKQAPADITVTAAGEGTGTAADVGGGAVDSTSIGHYKDVDYAIKAPPADAEGVPAVPVPSFRLQATTLATSTVLEHERITAIGELWRFLVGHPSKAALVAAQPDLKSKLKAVLPLADALTGSVVLSKMTVGTALGSFALDDLSEAFRAGGADNAGREAFTLRFAGLSLPEGLVPPWATALVPTSLELSQSVGPVDVTPALLTLIDAMDLGAAKPLSDAQQAAFANAFSGQDMTVSIKPSSLATPTLALELEGEVRLAKPMPTGTMTIRATGLDKTIEAVQTAALGDPVAMQAVTMLVAAKGLGKAEGADSYAWHIVAGPGGELTVNGVLLSGLVPQAQPAPLTP